MKSHRVIVKPSECAVAFCLPLDKASFLASLQHYGAYSHRYQGGWLQYKQLFADEAQYSLSVFQKLGVSVNSDVTVSRFLDMLTGGAWKVVLLFSHWHGDAVEFSDGFCEHNNIVAALPHSVRITVDLCVCHPNALVKALLTKHTELHLRAIPNESFPPVWLAFYTVFFRILGSGEYSYFEAFELVAREFVKQTAHSKGESHNDTVS